MLLLNLVGTKSHCDLERTVLRDRQHGKVLLYSAAYLPILETRQLSKYIHTCTNSAGIGLGLGHLVLS